MKNVYSAQWILFQSVWNVIRLELERCLCFNGNKLASYQKYLQNGNSWDNLSLYININKHAQILPLQLTLRGFLPYDW